MQFPKTIIQPILAGSVTQCRFPAERWKPKLTESLRAVHEHRDETGWIFRRTAGDPLPVRLKIVHYHLAPLDSTTDEHAQQEGYRTRADLERVYLNAYGGAWTNQMCWVIRFELDKTEQHQPMYGPWDPGDESRRRAPEPEKVDARPFAQEAERKWRRDQAQREAIYRAMPLDQKLRLVQQDERLRIAGRDDLRVIEKRLEAIWNRGKAA